LGIVARGGSGSGYAPVGLWFWGAWFCGWFGLDRWVFGGGFGWFLLLT